VKTREGRQGSSNTGYRLVMQRKRLAGMECSIARTLDVVGDWWTLMIVRDLFAFKGHYRFDEIHRSLGISRNILADRLAALCENGIAERRPYQDRPPRFEYRLTRKGQDLFPVVMALLAWGDKWTAGENGPPVLLRHTTCDHDASPVMSCSHCGEPFTGRTVEGRDAPHLATPGRTFT
jgi:DNA-binding HxlR family transcriptional regulator